MSDIIDRYASAAARFETEEEALSFGRAVADSEQKFPIGLAYVVVQGPLCVAGFVKQDARMLFAALASALGAEVLFRDPASGVPDPSLN